MCPVKGPKVTTADPLEKLLPFLVHSMAILAHSVDMQNPNTPMAMEVNSALDMK